MEKQQSETTATTTAPAPAPNERLECIHIENVELNLEAGAFGRAKERQL